MNDDLKSWKGTPVVPLDENASLYKGDRIVIRFKWFLGGGGTYLKAAQLAIIDKKLANRSDFRIISFVDQGDYLDCEVEVLASPATESVSPDSGVTQTSFVVSTGVVVCVALISATILGVTVALLYHSCYRMKLVEKGVLPPPTSYRASLGEIAGGLHILVYVAGVLVVLYVFRNLFSNTRGRRNHTNNY
ncbi:hypothetical protein ES705_10640 [subsurface metagenome]